MNNSFLDALPSVSFSSRRNLPGIHAVYFAISRWNEVLYIGKSWYLRHRWQPHTFEYELDYLGCSTIAWIEVKDLSFRVKQHLVAVERFYIKKFHPLLNERQKSPQLKA